VPSCLFSQWRWWPDTNKWAVSVFEG
jgi:hypothetical protein